jgi:uncharacterized membrane protein
MIALFVIMSVVAAALLVAVVALDIRMYRRIERYHRALDEQRRQGEADSRRYASGEALR